MLLDIMKSFEALKLLKYYKCVCIYHLSTANFNETTLSIYQHDP